MPIRHPGETSPPPRAPVADPGRPAGSPCARPAPRGFTLVELLVAIGIITVLVAILLPVMARARSASQNVGCLSNLRQIMMAFSLYASDNNHQLPDPVVMQESWESSLRPYVPTRDVYHCHADGGLFENLRSSYDWRDTPNPRTTVAGKSFLAIRRTDTLFVFDALPDWHAKGRINVAQADGTALSMSYQDCLRDLDKPISF